MKLYLVWGNAKDCSEDTDIWVVPRQTVVVAADEQEALDLVYQTGNFIVPRLDACVEEIPLSKSSVVLSSYYDK